MSASSTTTSTTTNKKIVIVGGGIIGLSILHQLCSLGKEEDRESQEETNEIAKNCMLLESCSSIAQHASGKAGGFLARHWCDGEGIAVESLARTGFDLHEKFADRVGHEKIQFRYMTAYSAEILALSEEKKKKKQQQQQENDKTENETSSSFPSFLDGRRIGNIECLTPGENEKNDSEASSNSSSNSNKTKKRATVAQVHPRLLCLTLADECIRMGATIKTNSHVTKLLISSSSSSDQDDGADEKEKVTGVVVSENIDDDDDNDDTVKKNKSVVIETDVCVLATGPWMLKEMKMISRNENDNNNNNNNNNSRLRKHLSQISSGCSANKVQSLVLKTINSDTKNSSDTNSSNTSDIPAAAIFTSPSNTLVQECFQQEEQQEKEETENSREESEEERSNNKLYHDALKCEPEIYPRPFNSEVYCCGIQDRDPLPDLPRNVALNEERLQILHKIVGEFSTRLAPENTEIVAKQSCFLPYSADKRTPICGRVPSSSNLYIAGLTSCWGILYSPSVALAIAEMIEGNHFLCHRHHTAASSSSSSQQEEKHENDNFASKIVKCLPKYFLDDEDDDESISDSGFCGKRKNLNW